MINWKHIRNFAESTEGLPCIDTQRFPCALIIKTPQLHQSPSHILLQPLGGQTHCRNSQHQPHACDNSWAPCRAALSPCALPLQHQPQPGDFVHFPPSGPQRVDRALVQWLQTKHWRKLQKNPSSPHSTQSSFSHDKIGTRILFPPREGHGVKVFHQSESNKFIITWALFKLAKSPAAKKCE